MITNKTYPFAENYQRNQYIIEEQLNYFNTSWDYNGLTISRSTGSRFADASFYIDVDGSTNAYISLYVNINAPSNLGTIYIHGINSGLEREILSLSLVSYTGVIDVPLRADDTGIRISIISTVNQNASIYISEITTSSYIVTTSVVGDGTVSTNRNYFGLNTLAEVLATSTGNVPFKYFEINNNRYTANPYEFIVENDTNVIAYFTYNIAFSKVGYGSVSVNKIDFLEGDTATISAYNTEQSKIWQFKEWQIGSDTITTNPYSFTVNQDYNVVAVFEEKYTVNLTYNSEYGEASYTYNASNITFTASLLNGSYFKGWYIDGSKYSNELSFNYVPIGNVNIEARFDVTHSIVTNVVGSGSIDYTRYGDGNNDIEFNVLPQTRWHFQKYVINGVEYTTTPLNITIDEDVTVTAYFEEDDMCRIIVSSNVPNASIYISQNNQIEPFTATVYARPLADYYFVSWDDGSTENPRELTVDTVLYLDANYHRVNEESFTYSYRCYIKDQLRMTDPPKAFLKVDNFDVKRDLITTSNSTINTINNATNINNGDVLVLYDAKGTTLYQGVIKSIEDNQISCSQMQSFYKGLWIYNVSPKATLEEEIAYLLGEYAQGKIYKSSYIDTLVAQRLGGITIQYEGSTTAHLPTDTDKDGNEQMTSKDMETFIYSLYEDYGIIFDFQINFSGANYVTIKVPTYQTLKVGNNMYAIKNMSPIQTIEETNRLIIFSKDKVYRTTYVATTNNNIVEAPTTTAQRFNITNTKVVYSDDPVSDLISANLPNTMYNHKLTFDLVIRNFIYEFGDFKLGGSLDVWYGEDYYNTVLTGYEIRKNTNQNITEVNFTCGLVRVALTKLLTLGKV